MNVKIIILPLFLILFHQINSFTFDLTQQDKHGKSLANTDPNKDTVIDFNFSPNTLLYGCSPTGCTISNAQQSTLTFLNVLGQEKTYTLQDATIQIASAGVSRSQQKGLFRFTFQNGNDIVSVGVPISDTISSATGKIYQFNLDSQNLDPSLSFLSTTSGQVKNSTGIPLSSFNYLNRMDLGIFYHVYSPTSSTTYLLSYFILSNMKISLTGLPVYADNFPPAGSVNYQATGDKLGYGSTSQGIFQTHLRESYVLWTAMIGIFFYWIYYLKTQHITIECYDKKYQNNKWTNWSIYSLHNLGHEQYFTKLTRQTMLLITFSWQGFVLALLYSNLPYGQGPTMIIWAAVIAYVTSVPFPYLLGYGFLSKIYESSLHKFAVMKKMQGHFNKKDGVERYEAQLDDLEQHLYGLYYWYYVIAFACFTAFWVTSVHEMRQIHRDYYYLQRYWLASLGIAFVIEHFIVDPLLTLIIGGYRCYQIRGFYYDYRLGEHFKQLEL